MAKVQLRVFHGEKRGRGGSSLPPRLCLCQDNEGSGGQDVVTGVEVTKLPPVPDTPNDKFPEARKFMDKR